MKWVRKRGDTNESLVFDLSPVSLDASGFTGRVLVTDTAGVLLIDRAPNSRTYAAETGTRITVEPLADDPFVTTSGLYRLEYEVTLPSGKVQTFPGGSASPRTLTIETVDDLG